MSNGIAILFAVTPLAFGMIRALRTGDDFRYLWVALASLLSAVIVLIVGNANPRSNRAAVRSATVFIIATVIAVLAASLVGARVGPGSVVVGAAFGFCYAAACALYLVSRRALHMHERRADEIVRENSPSPPEAFGTPGSAMGIVKWWSNAKGYGAIAVDKLAPWDVWCHFSHIQAEGYRSLTAGELVEVEYYRVDQDSFKFVARLVRRVQPETNDDSVTTG